MRTRLVIPGLSTLGCSLGCDLKEGWIFLPSVDILLQGGWSSLLSSHVWDLHASGVSTCTFSLCVHGGTGFRVTTTTAFSPAGAQNPFVDQLLIRASLAGVSLSQPTDPSSTTGS